METVILEQLRFPSRRDALAFLKKLWRGEAAPCPFCGKELELLRRKAKRSDCDWQCRTCCRVFRAIRLLDELNRQMPD